MDGGRERGKERKRERERGGKKGNNSMMRTKMDGLFLYSLMCGTDAPVCIATAMEMGLYFLQL